MRQRNNVHSLKDLKMKLELVRRAVRATERDLSKLGEALPSEPLTVRRQREALRRRRAAYLLQQDRLMSELAGRGATGRRAVRTSKAGVRSIVQGGLPGSGKRS